MKLIDIVKQLAINIPQYNSLLTENSSITSLTYVGTTATATVIDTTLIGGMVVISDAQETIDISLNYNTIDRLVTCTSTINHGLIAGKNEFVTVQNTTNGYNGTFQILEATDKTFKYKLDTAPTSNIDTGNIIFDSINYNGIFTPTITSGTTFTYTMASTPVSIGLNAINHISTRIESTIAYERAKEFYINKNTNLNWLFIVPEGRTISKDRSLNSDGVFSYQGGQNNRIRQIQNFSLFFFKNTTGEILANNSFDEMEDFCIALTKSIHGAVLPEQNYNNSTFGVVLTGDEVFEYSSSFYVHKFDLQAERDITWQDMYKVNSALLQSFEIRYNNNLGVQIINDTGVLP